MDFNVFRIAKGLERREEAVYEPDFDGFLILLEIYEFTVGYLVDVYTQICGIL